MTRFSPKSFAQPDLLRTIQPGNLVRLLEPGRQFLEERGLVLPTGSDPVIDYEQLSEILIQPDEFMPSQLIEGLHVISQLGTEANFDQLCEIAQRNFIEVDAEATAIDLAACLWIEVPSMLVVKEREIGANRRRRFESFCARAPSNSSSRIKSSRAFQRIFLATDSLGDQTPGHGRTTARWLTTPISPSFGYFKQARLTHIMNLTLLAPDIQEAILIEDSFVTASLNEHQLHAVAVIFG